MGAYRFAIIGSAFPRSKHASSTCKDRYDRSTQTAARALPLAVSPRAPRVWPQSREATRAVQPVWWLAPRPRPVSPSKYSNITRHPSPWTGLLANTAAGRVLNAFTTRTRNGLSHDFA